MIGKWDGDLNLLFWIDEIDFVVCIREIFFVGINNEWVRRWGGFIFCVGNDSLKNVWIFFFVGVLGGDYLS